MKTPQSISPEDLRAAIAHSGIPAYVIAGRAHINPIKVSRLVRGHDPITSDVAAKLLLAIQQEVAAARGR